MQQKEPIQTNHAQSTKKQIIRKSSEFLRFC